LCLLFAKFLVSATLVFTSGAGKDVFPGGISPSYEDQILVIYFTYVPYSNQILLNTSLMSVVAVTDDHPWPSGAYRQSRIETERNV
jgi:hypothetical protein